MLSKLTLTNFRKHRDLVVDFQSGLSTIRAPNEKGKTSILEAIAYALFGVKAIRSSLEDAVTWGEPVATLKVALEFGQDGTAYSLKRGKSGAELTAGGLIVTGQNEVTAYVCRLLKVDAKSAVRLMFANQNEIRGALEAGTAATAELIQQLAEFDQIDGLIELIQEKLTLGSTSTVEAGITAATRALDVARAGLVAPDNAAHARTVDASILALGQAEQALQRNEERIEELRTAAAGWERQAAARASAVEASAAAARRVDRAKAKLDEAAAVPAPNNDAGWVSAQRHEITRLESASVIRAAHDSVAGLLGEPGRAVGDRYEGTFGDLAAEISTTGAQRHRQATLAASMRADAQLARSKISTGACATCGQDISHLPDVAARNVEFEAEATRAEALVVAHSKKESQLADYLAALEAIRDESAPRIRALDRYAAYLSADTLLPPTLTWTGGEVPQNAAGTIAEIKAGIARAEAEQRAYAAAQALVGAATADLELAEAEATAAQTLLAGCPDVEGELTRNRGLLAVESQARAGLQETQRAAARTLATAEGDRRAILETYERAVKAASQAEDALAARQAELKALVFNNALLKAVRAARPLVADRLWGLVLAAVSRYFSEMRGHRSVVKKDSDGFKVDGHTITTLSGSTLDILGLAIRVALTRTFLPTAPFFVLDEPFHGCDDQRTESALGFLSTLGMPQVLLVTHEDVSDTVADNLIEI